MTRNNQHFNSETDTEKVYKKMLEVHKYNICVYGGTRNNIPTVH